MSTQITVRLPEALVALVDRRVERGEARSRAEVVERALERERRREIAERDAAILAGTIERTDHDHVSNLDDLARFATSVPLDDLD